jgi:hypothetical protein
VIPTKVLCVGSVLVWQNSDATWLLFVFWVKLTSKRERDMKLSNPNSANPKSRSLLAGKKTISRYLAIHLHH